MLVLFPKSGLELKLPINSGKRSLATAPGFFKKGFSVRGGADFVVSSDGSDGCFSVIVLIGYLLGYSAGVLEDGSAAYGFF